MTGYVYALINPATKNPIYVGSTTTTLYKRWHSHKSSIKTSKSPLYEYLRGAQIIPEILLLEEVEIKTKFDLSPIERKWVYKLRNDKHELLNSQMPSKTNIPTGAININVLKSNYLLIKEYLSEEFYGASIGKFYDKAAMERLEKLKKEKIK